MNARQPIGTYHLKRYGRRDQLRWVLFFAVAPFIFLAGTQIESDRFFKAAFGISGALLGWGLYVLVGIGLVLETVSRYVRLNGAVYASSVTLYPDQFELQKHNQTSTYRWGDIQDYTFRVVSSGSVKYPYIDIVTSDGRETVFNEYYEGSNQLISQLKKLISAAMLPVLIERIQAGSTVVIDENQFDLRGITVDDERFEWAELVDFKVLTTALYSLYFKIPEDSELVDIAISTNKPNAVFVPDLVERFAPPGKLPTSPIAIAESTGLR